MFSLIRNLKVVKKGLFACLLLCLACNSDEPLTGGRGFESHWQTRYQSRHEALRWKSESPQPKTSIC